MKRIHAGIICSLVMLFVISAPGALKARAAEGALDGKTFNIMMGETGKKGEKDELVFKDGKFTSVECQQYGFGEAPYTASVSGDATTFEADTVSDKEGKMHWSGAMKGGELAGTVVWSKEGQTPIEYWFKTTLQK